MPSIIAESELFRSCEILFGLELNLSREFLEYLQHAGIKSAYRKKARETHPDLAAGKSEHEKKALAAVFQSVHEAYENLKAYLDARDNKGYRLQGTATRRRSAPASASTGRKASSTARPESRHQQQARTQSQARAGRRDYASATQTRPFPHTTVDTEHYYKGPIPNRKLLFGHYLYYAGAINWRCIVQALVWQRAQRPRLGELGKKFGWLSESDIRRVMEYRTPFQPFGDSAVKLGLLTEKQRNILVFQQKRLQKRFGHYFVEHKIMSPQMLQRHVDGYNAHNARVRDSAPFWYSC